MNYGAQPDWKCLLPASQMSLINWAAWRVRFKPDIREHFLPVDEAALPCVAINITTTKNLIVFFFASERVFDPKSSNKMFWKISPVKQYKVHSIASLKIQTLGLPVIGVSSKLYASLWFELLWKMVVQVLKNGKGLLQNFKLWQFSSLVPTKVWNNSKNSQKACLNNINVFLGS